MSDEKCFKPPANNIYIYILLAGGIGACAHIGSYKNVTVKNTSPIKHCETHHSQG